MYNDPSYFSSYQKTVFELTFVAKRSFQVYLLLAVVKKQL